MDDLSNELETLNESVGSALFYDYYLKTGKMIERLGPMESDPSVPFEVWLGIASALADSSGYRIILQETIVGNIPDSNGTFPILGYRDREIVEPGDISKSPLLRTSKTRSETNKAAPVFSKTCVSGQVSSGGACGVDSVAERT